MMNLMKSVNNFQPDMKNTNSKWTWENPNWLWLLLLIVICETLKENQLLHLLYVLNIYFLVGMETGLLCNIPIINGCVK